MKFFNSILVVTMLATSLFASCSKDEERGGNGTGSGEDTSSEEYTFKANDETFYYGGDFAGIKGSDAHYSLIGNSFYLLQFSAWNDHFPTLQDLGDPLDWYRGIIFDKMIDDGQLCIAYFDFASAKQGDILSFVPNYQEFHGFDINNHLKWRYDYKIKKVVEPYVQYGWKTDITGNTIKFVSFKDEILTLEWDITMDKIDTEKTEGASTIHLTGTVSFEKL